MASPRVSDALNRIITAVNELTTQNKSQDIPEWIAHQIEWAAENIEETVAELLSEDGEDEENLFML